MESSIDDVYVDALRHPDPSGAGLLNMLDAVRRHVRDEAASVRTYARLADEAHDPVVTQVLRMLVDDEKRHHAAFERIAASLEDRLAWSAEQSAAGAADASDFATVQLVQALEEEEHDGARVLRQLAHRARRSDEYLSCLLLEAMAMDSDKHAHLLRMVAERLSHRG
jgi:rubrerythrin